MCEKVCLCLFGSDQQNNFFFIQTQEKIKKKEMELWVHPVNFEYLENETHGFHLRIADVCTLKKGKVLHLLCFDRNIADLVEDDNPPDIAVSATEFLRKAQRARYTHSEGLKGAMQFVGVNNVAHPFEFHIESKEHNFTPLKNGKFANTHWSEVRSDVRIGWRGPMVVEGLLEHFPLVYRPRRDLQERILQVKYRKSKDRDNRPTRVLAFRRKSTD